MDDLLGNLSKGFKAATLRASQNVFVGLSSRPVDASILQKYQRYEHSVQSPFAAIRFINQEYRTLNNGRRALALREDFGGTGWLACEWVKQGPRHTAVAVDLSPEPIEYGQLKHVKRLKDGQKKRVQYLLEDVRKERRGKFDVIVALNFSYGVLQSRDDLKEYFRKVRKALKPGGLFVVDLFGGTRAQDQYTRKRKYDGFTYYWECSFFNPVTNRGAFAIHFKPDGKKIMRHAFSYDWRLWSCPELREVMLDAGFSAVTPYWEGDGRDGKGDGKFTPTEWEENCRVWQSFMIAQR